MRSKQVENLVPLGNVRRVACRRRQVRYCNVKRRGKLKRASGHFFDACCPGKHSLLSVAVVAERLGGRHACDKGAVLGSSREQPAATANVAAYAEAVAAAGSH